jgi:tetratricopeptide (TPR) repeat protein
MRGKIALVAVILSASARASFYDFDATLDLNKGLPPVQAILAGKFEQHSTEYYAHVIPEEKRRSTSRYVPGKPIDVANAIVLAPALARSGDLTGALEAVDPLRNLATDSPIENSMRASILMALGDLKTAVEELKSFRQSTPSSPFGREEYELKLAQYLLEADADSTLVQRQPTFVRGLLINQSELAPNGASTEPSSEIWLEKARDADPQQIQKAMTAIIAMIRFGDLGSAHLYAALGDLLRVQGDAPLAYRAYRRALEHAHPWPAALEREIESIRQELGTDPRISDATIDAEQRSAQAWVRAYQAFEMRLLREDRLQGVSSVWEPFYAEHGNLREAPVTTWARTTRWAARMWPALTIITMILLVSTAMLIRWLRQRFGSADINAAD